MSKVLQINEDRENKSSEFSNHEIYIRPENFSHLVDFFAWAIQEDKKQNPELYQNNKII